MAYRKLETLISIDGKFRELSDNAKLLFYSLYFHSNSTSLGAMKCSIPGMAAEMGWTEEKARKAFYELSGAERLPESLSESLSESTPEAFVGFIKIDEKACYLEFPNFLKHNHPENPNVVKSWSRSWELIPECDLKLQLYQRVKDFAEGLGEAFAKAFREAFPEPSRKGMPKGMRKHEHEHEHQHQHEEKTLSSVDDIFAFCLDTLPIKPNKKTAARVNQIKTRLNQYSPVEIKLAISTMKNDKWLMGDNPDSKVYLTFEYVFQRRDNISKFLDIAKSVKNIKESVENQPTWEPDFIPESERESSEVLRGLLGGITKKA